MGSAEDAKKEAMDRVERSANAAWKAAAKTALFKVAAHQRYFTADDVMAAISPDVKTHELRALGPIMLNAAREHWIIKSSLPPINCKRRNCHAAPITVWESLLI